MPLVTGQITQDGAIIGVFVGVSRNREDKLKKNNMVVPPTIGVRAEIDTGSFYTIFQPSIFLALGIQPVRRIPIRTPSTRPGEPCEADQYHVSVQLVSGMETKYLPGVLALASEDFHDDDPAQAVIGRDILDHCLFTYNGPEKTFDLAFNF